MTKSVIGRNMFWGAIWLLTLSRVYSTQQCEKLATYSTYIDIYANPESPVHLLNFSSTKVLFLGKIETIQEKAFIKNPQLERVEFLGTSTTSVEDGAFEGLSSLMVLEISGTNLTELPDEIFKDLSQLASLYLTQNKIQNISEKLFSGLRKLRDLRLNSNDIDYISMKAFDDLGQLETLDLSKNSINNFPPNILSLANLEEINMQGNKITHLEYSSKPCEKLERLFLGNNFLNEVSKNAFAQFPVLKLLDLQKNNITSILHGVFSKLSQLELLDISSNNIENLSQGAFDGLGHLTELNLENNLIHSLPAEDFKQLPSLHTLKLSNNKLKTLTGSLLEEFRKIKKVNLHDNPWQCDCEIADYFDSGDNTFTIVCMGPETLRNKTLSSLNKQLICPTRTPAGKTDTPQILKNVSISPDTSKSTVSQPPYKSHDGSTKDFGPKKPIRSETPTTLTSSAGGSMNTTQEHNWSSVSKIVLATMAPLLTLLFLFILTRLYTRTKGYTVRPVDPRLKPVKLVDEENCKLLYVHELSGVIPSPEQSAVPS